MVKKLFVVVAVLFVATLFGCSSQKNYNANDLKSLTNNYTLEQAREENCLVMEDGSVTSGQDIFDDFLAKTENKEPASIRVVKYYTLDKSTVSPELYEQEKDKYPVMCITDVIYKNGTFTTYSYENLDDELFEKTFKYMVKDEYIANPQATFTTSLNYILVNDKNVTYDKIMSSMLSSTCSDNDTDLSNFIVYQKRNYK